MPDPFDQFGGIDFSGAKEPLANLWTAVGREVNGRLCIMAVRPHAFRGDLAGYVTGGWRNGEREIAGRILWGVDFPLGVPRAVSAAFGVESGWESVVDWVADRGADDVRAAAGDSARTLRATDTVGGLAPLDLRLYKQTVEGLRWLQHLREEAAVGIHPQAIVPDASTVLVEVYPSSTVHELGLPRRRSPSRPGEVRARAAALRTFLDFDSPHCEALVVTLEDAWDATIACLTAYLCRNDLDQPFRASAVARETVEREGWIYRPPVILGASSDESRI